MGFRKSQCLFQGNLRIIENKNILERILKKIATITAFQLFLRSDQTHILLDTLLLYPGNFLSFLILTITSTK